MGNFQVVPSALPSRKQDRCLCRAGGPGSPRDAPPAFPRPHGGSPAVQAGSPAVSSLCPGAGAALRDSVPSPCARPPHPQAQGSKCPGLPKPGLQLLHPDKLCGHGLVT